MAERQIQTHRSSKKQDISISRLLILGLKIEFQQEQNEITSTVGYDIFRIDNGTKTIYEIYWRYQKCTYR